MRFLPIAMAAAAPLEATGWLENPRCEETAAGAYRITFDAPREAFPVQVFAASGPDRHTGKPVRIARRSPVDVTVSGQSGRVYFHLKPARGAVLVVAVRVLPMEGASNFRDLGGYTGAGGRTVRWGMLYRSSQLNRLTARDYEYLATLRIRLVCDLRVDFERNAAPTQWQSDTPPELLPASVDTFSYVPATAGIRERMTMMYERMVFDAIPQFREVLRRILDGQTPVLLHCTAGKDRTGMLSALLLRALGVAPEVVRQDYLLSNRYYRPDAATLAQIGEYMKRMGQVGPVDEASMVRLLGVDAEYLETAMRAIDARYGSFDSYLRESVSLTVAEIGRLRELLLAE